jgi:serine/threonine-protein kinase
MTLPQGWPRLKEVFEGARALPVDARPGYLAAACSGDDALRHDVETLLASHERATSFLETPALLVDDSTTVRNLEGQTLGVYEISSRIGTGGMGEVYRARDRTLNRDVAIKFLLPAVAHDRDRLERFGREARLLASLNHPHIAQVYGLEDAGGLHGLVMELVEGPTLAELIARRPISLDEAMRIATQLAEALAAAHEHGIVHRDLKPANIKIREDGTVKVLDFGLAKALEAMVGAADAVDSPAPGAPPSEPGVILGTAAYMSPEQARGKPVDKRADIWAFGAVLYEMLTGRTAFPGETVSDTIAAILQREPDWAALSANVPSPVSTLIRGCLAKQRLKRIGDIAVARFVLEDSESAPSWQTAIAPRPSRRRRLAVHASIWLLGVGMSGAAVWFATVWFTGGAPNPLPHVTRFEITPPSASALTISGFYNDLALTPDGTRLVYVGGDGAALFVRSLDQLDATPLTGFNAAFGPFVSPDGQWIGVFDGASAPALKKVAIAGGPVITLARPDAPTRGASWGADGSIIFATTNATTGLQRIPAAGGEATVLTRPNRAAGEADHLWPEILPDGHSVLFTITALTGRLDQSQIALLDLRAGTQTVLIRGGSDARYVSSGHLIYATEGTLRAVAFDLARLAVVGDSAAVLPQVRTAATGAAKVAVAANGTLVYVPAGGAAAESSLVWVDRQGQETRLPAPPRSYVYPRLSPNGTRFAFFLSDQDLDIWLLEPSRATLTRLTSDKGLETYPVWAPDGRRVFFSSERDGARNLFVQAESISAITRLTESASAQYPTSISPDGRRLVFTELAPATSASDVLQLELEGTHAVTPLVRTPFDERNGEVSPDGRWLAYEANNSGRFEVYARPFPDVTAGLWQVSTDGGTRPLWARNGHELFYLTESGTLMRVGVTGGAAWAPTAPTKLFDARGRYGAADFHNGRTYDVSPDGRRFLMIKRGAAGGLNAAPASMVVVLDWFEELKRRVAASQK